MEVFLIVLKIIGIALLSVIGLLLLIVLLLLFWPFFYRIEAAKTDTVSAKVIILSMYRRTLWRKRSTGI